MLYFLIFANFPYFTQNCIIFNSFCIEFVLGSVLKALFFRPSRHSSYKIFIFVIFVEKALFWLILPLSLFNLFSCPGGLFLYILF